MPPKKNISLQNNNNHITIVDIEVIVVTTKQQQEPYCPAKKYSFIQEGTILPVSSSKSKTTEFFPIVQHLQDDQ